MPKVAARLPYPLAAIPTGGTDSAGRKGGAFGNFGSFRVRPHRGTDFSLYWINQLGLSRNFGSVTAGTVVAVEGNDIGELGRYAIIQDGEGWFWQYSHCERVLVRLGQSVSIGTLVGVMGSSGTAASPGSEHLHLSLSNTKYGGINGTVYDPVKHIQARQTIPAAGEWEEIMAVSDADALKIARKVIGLREIRNPITGNNASLSAHIGELIGDVNRIDFATRDLPRKIWAEPLPDAEDPEPNTLLGRGVEAFRRMRGVDHKTRDIREHLEQLAIAPTLVADDGASPVDPVTAAMSLDVGTLIAIVQTKLSTSSKSGDQS